jgi:hypothetical protein
VDEWHLDVLGDLMDQSAVLVVLTDRSAEDVNVEPLAPILERCMMRHTRAPLIVNGIKFGDEDLAEEKKEEARQKFGMILMKTLQEAIVVSSVPSLLLLRQAFLRQIRDTADIVRSPLNLVNAERERFFERTRNVPLQLELGSFATNVAAAVAMANMLIGGQIHEMTLTRRAAQAPTSIVTHVQKMFFGKNKKTSQSQPRKGDPAADNDSDSSLSSEKTNLAFGLLKSFEEVVQGTITALPGGLGLQEVRGRLVDDLQQHLSTRVLTTLTLSLRSTLSRQLALIVANILRKVIYCEDRDDGVPFSMLDEDDPAEELVETTSASAAKAASNKKFGDKKKERMPKKQSPRHRFLRSLPQPGDLSYFLIDTEEAVRYSLALEDNEQPSDMTNYLDVAETTAALLQGEFGLASSPGEPEAELWGRAKKVSFDLCGPLDEAIKECIQTVCKKDFVSDSCIKECMSDDVSKELLEKLEAMISGEGRLIDKSYSIMNDAFKRAKTCFTSGRARHRDQELTKVVQVAVTASRALASYNRKTRPSVFPPKITTAKRLIVSQVIAPQLAEILDSKRLRSEAQVADNFTPGEAVEDGLDTPAAVGPPSPLENHGDDGNDSDSSEEYCPPNPDDDAENPLYKLWLDDAGRKALSDHLKPKGVQKVEQAKHIYQVKLLGDQPPASDESEHGFHAGTLDFDGSDPTTLTVSFRMSEKAKKAFAAYVEDIRQKGGERDEPISRPKRMWPIFVILSDMKQVDETVVNFFYTRSERDQINEDETSIVHFVIYLCSNVEIATAFKERLKQLPEREKDPSTLILGAAEMIENERLEVLLDVARSFCARKKLDYWWLLPHNLARMSEYDKFSVTMQRCTVPAALLHSELLMERLEAFLISLVYERFSARRKLVEAYIDKSVDSSQEQSVREGADLLHQWLTKEMDAKNSHKGFYKLGARKLLKMAQKAVGENCTAKSGGAVSKEVVLPCDLAAELLAPLALWLRAGAVYTLPERYALTTLLSRPSDMRVEIRSKPKLNYLSPMLFNVHACLNLPFKGRNVTGAATEGGHLCRAIHRYINVTFYAKDSKRLRRFVVVDLGMHFHLDIPRTHAIGKTGEAQRREGSSGDTKGRGDGKRRRSTPRAPNKRAKRVSASTAASPTDSAPQLLLTEGSAEPPAGLMRAAHVAGTVMPVMCRFANSDAASVTDSDAFINSDSEASCDRVLYPSHLPNASDQTSKAAELVARIRKSGNLDVEALEQLALLALEGQGGVDEEDDESALELLTIAVESGRAPARVCYKLGVLLLTMEEGELRIAEAEEAFLAIKHCRERYAREAMEHYGTRLLLAMDGRYPCVRIGHKLLRAAQTNRATAILSYDTLARSSSDNPERARNFLTNLEKGDDFIIMVAPFAIEHLGGQDIPAEWQTPSFSLKRSREAAKRLMEAAKENRLTGQEDKGLSVHLLLYSYVRDLFDLSCSCDQHREGMDLLYFAQKMGMSEIDTLLEEAEADAADS